MSETTEKNAPCAWCGNVPEYVEAWDMWQHPRTGCIEAVGQFFAPADWDNRQAAILARRRADFEAGAGLHYNANLTLGRQRMTEAWDAYLSRKGDANG
jgi:hypothetical protein